jgi:hypothetical protein
VRTVAEGTEVGLSPRIGALLIALLGTYLSATVSVSPARADYPFSFVEITCAPEIHFAAVRRFWVYNLPQQGRYLDSGGDPRPDAQAAVESRHRIFTSRALAKHPQTCEIPALVAGADTIRPAISLSITARVDANSAESSYARIRDEVNVRLFGTPLVTFGMNPHGISRGEDSVEISADGVGLMIRTCILSPDDETAVSCKRINRP